MWEFFRKLQIGDEFIVWLTCRKKRFVKVSSTTGYCAETNKTEKFAEGCMVKMKKSSQKLVKDGTS